MCSDGVLTVSTVIATWVPFFEDGDYLFQLDIGSSLILREISDIYYLPMLNGQFRSENAW